jgi:hypothetical protein
MNAIRIELATGRYVFAPGEALAGLVEWTLPVAPASFELRLFWHTTGTGRGEVGVVWSAPLPSTAAGRHDFTAPLPAGPYSYDGQLFQVCWALEAVAELPASGVGGGGEEVTRVDLTVSPIGAAIRPSAAIDRASS